MKLTDLALIFIAILLPIVIIIYVNVAFVVKAEKEEMYYKNLMNTAIVDGVDAMKEVENENNDIDYGYSGIVDKKVSINAKEGINAFYKSLFNNFNISGNKSLELNFKNYIPAIAIIDYNGVYIYSAEQTKDKSNNTIITWTLKPKKYFTSKYCIIDKGAEAIPRYEIKNFDLVQNENIVENRIYEITLSMDDYIVLNTFLLNDQKILIKDSKEKTAFYLTDEINNGVILQGVLSTIDEDSNSYKVLKKSIIDYLSSVKKTVIANTVSNEITYAINAHNKIARYLGITYNFYSPYAIENKTDDIFDDVRGIGMIAFIQGISLGNRKLNYKAYSISDLSLTKKYYLSIPLGNGKPAGPVSYNQKRLYHNSENCPVYKDYLKLNTEIYNPSFVINKQEAATLGFYPCPVCKP